MLQADKFPVNIKRKSAKNMKLLAPWRAGTNKLFYSRATDVCTQEVPVYPGLYVEPGTRCL